MASRLNPYLNFRGQAREALAFYESVLGGDVATTTFGQFGDQPGSEADVVHGQLETQVWGDESGQCTDRSGVPWLVTIGAD